MMLSAIAIARMLHEWCCRGIYGNHAELASLIFKLLPGFVTAWVFAGLTAYRRKGPFERIAQALVFSAFAQVVTISLKTGAIFIGHRVGAIGAWTDDSSMVCSILVAVALGVLFAFLGNKSVVHDYLWKRGITNGSSYPSNWYKTFACEKKWVVLHLKDNRRLYGWASDWPDQSKTGHFVMTEVEWILEDETRIALPQVAKLLLASDDIEMVEFVYEPGSEIVTETHSSVDEDIMDSQSQRPNEKES